MGERWKQYEREGKWVYEQHPFWITGWTFWDLKTEAPDLFIHLANADLVIFKVRHFVPFDFGGLFADAFVQGDLNHRSWFFLLGSKRTILTVFVQNSRTTATRRWTRLSTSRSVLSPASPELPPVRPLPSLTLRSHS